MAEKTYVWFSIRIRSHEPMITICSRVSQVLGCRFTVGHDSALGDVQIMDAEVMCLQLRISQWQFYGDATEWVYQLKGESVIEPRWDYSAEIDLTAWMLMEFREQDSTEWYVPTIEELRNEAGID
jgi:hypothetical protein